MRYIVFGLFLLNLVGCTKLPDGKYTFLQNSYDRKVLVKQPKFERNFRGDLKVTFHDVWIDYYKLQD